LDSSPVSDANMTGGSEEKGLPACPHEREKGAVSSFQQGLRGWKKTFSFPLEKGTPPTIFPQPKETRERTRFDLLPSKKGKRGAFISRKKVEDREERTARPPPPSRAGEKREGRAGCYSNRACLREEGERRPNSLITAKKEKEGICHYLLVMYGRVREGGGEVNPASVRSSSLAFAREKKTPRAEQ